MRENFKKVVKKKQARHCGEMVCLQHPTKQQQNSQLQQTDIESTETNSSLNHKIKDSTDEHAESKMDFSDSIDPLQLQYLAGCDIVSHPPLFTPSGEYLLLISKNIIKVYATATGELTRELLGATDDIISMEFEVKQKEILIACTNAGLVLHWHWRTGEVLRKCNLTFRKGVVLDFKLLNMYKDSETACAVATIRCDADHVQWFVFDSSSGEHLHIPCGLRLPEPCTPLLAVGTNSFKTMALVQDCTVFFIKYDTWKWRNLRNAYRVPITVVRVHPTEDLVATGDATGKVFLWRQYMSPQTVRTSLYHWHHTSITSIAFSAAGSSFYSSGLESVLVKWNIERTDIRDFLPRTSSIICQIAVNDDNTKVAICTADNGVQFVGSDNQLKSTLQEFTYIIDDKTEQSKFPVGLRLNPRSSALVLNGRVGHLQFYSANTKKFLYNLDIVQQNRLSIEMDKILYNIRVTKAAFNIDWMATGEVYNDEEHLPELRLKFWKYEEESQGYVLNTSVELPHELGFRAIEFSNAYRVDNLLCGTAGEDKVIRVWSLEDSDNIYKQGKVWYCVAQTDYKQMPIESISFSQDGSLLAAGCGNTLCVYKANTLKLKTALTSAGGHDGHIRKAKVIVPTGEGNNVSRSELLEEQKRVMQQFTNLLEQNDDTLIKELRKATESEKATKQQSKPLDRIDDEKQKSYLFNKILQMSELNLYQKLQLYQRLGIHCQVAPEWQTRMMNYLRETIAPESVQQKLAKLRVEVRRLNMRERFKAKYRLQQYEMEKRRYDSEVAQHLVPIMSLLNLNENSNYSEKWHKKKNTQNARVNGVNGSESEEEPKVPESMDSSLPLPQPQQTPVQITHVQFAAGEYAHLVIVCTTTRVLVWNLLNLRLHAVLKVSVEHLAFDPQTNLIAAFTKYNELYVFQPNVPLTIYHRRDLPALYGAIWLPRTHPKHRSINVDWQSQSTLYFLTHEQEIMYLGSPKELTSSESAPVVFKNAAPETLQYSTFGTFATKQHSDKIMEPNNKLGPLVLGNSAKSAMNEFIEMSTHTMPPLSLICADLVKSMVKPAETSTAYKKTKYAATNGLNGYTSHPDDDDEDDDEDDDDDDDDNSRNDKMVEDTEEAADKIEKRRNLMQKELELNEMQQESNVKTKDAWDLETRLKNVASEEIDLTF